MKTHYGTSLTTSLSNEAELVEVQSESQESSASDDQSQSIYVEESVSSLSRQLLASPNSSALHMQLAFALLLRGRYEEGWREYEWRQSRVPTLSAIGPLKQWRGERLSNGRLLVIAEQGLGDNIQFLRYLPFVASQMSEVILYVPKTLKRLAQCIPGVGRVVSDLAEVQEMEYFCPIMSLPFCLQTSISSIPFTEGYLRAGLLKGFGTPTKLSRSDLKVGIAWAGNPKHRRDSERSMPLSFLEPLLQSPGAKFFSFQVGEAQKQLSSARFASNVQDLSPQLLDMQDTADVLSEMDLLVTVDTAVAHLGGALGKPVWLMLAEKPDWRWKQATPKSDWYQSIELFRQPYAGNWAGVVSKVRSRMTNLSAGRTFRRTNGSGFSYAHGWPTNEVFNNVFG